MTEGKREEEGKKMLGERAGDHKSVRKKKKRQQYFGQGKKEDDNIAPKKVHSVLKTKRQR